MEGSTGLKSNFYSEEELGELGLKSFGEDVHISRKASIYGAEHISIGSHVRVDDFCILSGTITIGNYIHIAAYSALYGSTSGITLDDFANISSRVCIYAVCDDYSGMSLTNPMVPDAYKHLEQAPVHIKKHVIIGSTSVVLPGVTLETGSAFGSFSLVRNSSEAWSINAGIPAKKIKDREKKLLELEKQFLEE